MKMRMQTFGEIEIDGERYDHDLVIERGGIRKRIKKPSKAYRAHYGHTPLSADEAIPWHGKNLFVGHRHVRQAAGHARAVRRG